MVTCTIVYTCVVVTCTIVILYRLYLVYDYVDVAFRTIIYAFMKLYIMDRFFSIVYILIHS